MKRFSFPLETARQWRSRQAELQEIRLQQLSAEKQAIEDRGRALEDELAAEFRRLENTSIDARDLATLDQFRGSVARERPRLRAALADCDKRIGAQRAAVIEARRAFQLIDKLRDKKLVEWHAAEAKEQEDLAAELYLARISRGEE